MQKGWSNTGGSVHSWDWISFLSLILHYQFPNSSSSSQRRLSHWEVPVHTKENQLSGSARNTVPIQVTLSLPFWLNSTRVKTQCLHIYPLLGSGNIAEEAISVWKLENGVKVSKMPSSRLNTTMWPQQQWLPVLSTQYHHPVNNQAWTREKANRTIPFAA